MAVHIVFETHARSVDNERGVASGWHGSELSAEGRRLASALGERRRADGIEAVFVSDLARAVETAEIAFRDTRIPIHRDQRLRECNYGLLNSAPVEQLDAERARRVDEPFPDGESYRDVVVRVARFLADLGRDHPGGRVLVIGHSATRWALDHLIDARPLEELVIAPFDWREGWEYDLI